MKPSDAECWVIVIGKAILFGIVLASLLTIPVGCWWSLINSGGTTGGW